MISVYQKFYSAINSLSSISKSNDFIDNISAIDTFLSEFRNITFIIQKKFSDGESKKVYSELCEKYLKNDDIMRGLVDFRNETTKEHPFDLVIVIDCIIYLIPSIRKNILTFNTLDSKLSSKKIETKVKKLLKSLEYKNKEIYFSYDCHFLSNEKDIDIIKYAGHGIDVMYQMLLEFEQQIYGNTDEYVNIKEKILFKLQKFLTNELELNTNCIYRQDTDEIIVSPKARIFGISKDKQIIRNTNRLLLDDDKGLLKGTNIKERFKSFVLNHIMIAHLSKELMPVFIIIYNDSTYCIESFPVFTKPEIYYNVVSLANRIKKDGIRAIFIAQEMISTTDNLKEYMNTTHEERMKNYNKDCLSFSMLSKENNIFVIFDRDKISDRKYVNEILEKFESNCEICYLFPLIKEFKEI